MSSRRSENEFAYLRTVDNMRHKWAEYYCKTALLSFATISRLNCVFGKTDPEVTMQESNTIAWCYIRAP